MKQFDWRRYLKACASSTRYCSLATVDKKGAVWVNAVYFAWDRRWHLYFISQPHARHVKNIAENGRIAVAVYSTRSRPQGQVVGIQLEGKARLLTKKKEVERAYTSYYGRKYPNTKKDKNGTSANDYVKDSLWHFFEIVPMRIYYFDTRFFGEKRVEVPKRFTLPPLLPHNS